MLVVGGFVLGVLVRSLVIGETREGETRGNGKFLSYSARHEMLFFELSSEEVVEIAEFVRKMLPSETSLRGETVLTKNYLSGTSAVELLPVPKEEAVAYLRGGGPRPPRLAKVTVLRGGMDVTEFRVDLKEGLIEPTSSYPFAKRPYDMGETSFLPLVEATVAQLKPLLEASFGSISVMMPFAFNDISSTRESRVSTVRFFWVPENFQAMWLHPYPLSFRIAQTSPDPEEWPEPYDFYYCGHGPLSLPELLDIPRWRRCEVRIDDRVNGNKGDWDIPGPTCGPSTWDKQRATTTKRKKNGAFVNWMDWEFAATVKPSTGLAIYDIHFKGKSVAYEISLAEAAALYSGVDSDQVFYLDSAYSMTQLSGDLIETLDCPSGAEIVYAPKWVFFENGGFESDPARAFPFKAACIFETIEDETLWRHTTFVTGKADGVRGRALAVRAVATVGNYDYITQMAFRLDGSIVCALKFGGFMETRYSEPGESILGEIVHDRLAAPLHSHFASFKVDLDVLGTSNSLEKTTVRAGNPTHVPIFDKYPTKWLDREILETETATDGRPLTYYRIINEDHAIGDATPSGYAIWPGPTVPQVLDDDHPFVRTCAFTKRAIVVTRRKDQEPRCTSIYDLYAPAHPTVTLDMFLQDEEPIRNTDLVAWVNVGKEHITRTEDLPLISSTFGAHFTLLPWNIFDKHAGQDISRDISAGRRCEDST
ncbi:hypothetical protein CTAYLR_010605 [Chrysophaeum taylorii]|uniref:Amine oxidase n=1 Tax=Chrysophaeum taylorii TaxID=2483200 RepID=A0AAD7UIT7_9STRA|nr:hypothetical protein CTAYLR_010605 [Chrysophaeum taylorii]